MKRALVVGLNIASVVVAAMTAAAAVVDFVPAILSSASRGPMATTTIAVMIIALVAVGALAVALNRYSRRRAKVSAEWVRTNLILGGWVLVLLGGIFIVDAATDSDRRFLHLAMGAVLLANGARMFVATNSAAPAPPHMNNP